MQPGIIVDTTQRQGAVGTLGELNIRWEQGIIREVRVQGRYNIQHTRAVCSRGRNIHNLSPIAGDTGINRRCIGIGCQCCLLTRTGVCKYIAAIGLLGQRTGRHIRHEARESRGRRNSHDIAIDQLHIIAQIGRCIGGQVNGRRITVGVCKRCGIAAIGRRTGHRILI